MVIERFNSTSGSTQEGTLALSQRQKVTSSPQLHHVTEQLPPPVSPQYPSQPHTGQGWLHSLCPWTQLLLGNICPKLTFSSRAWCPCLQPCLPWAPASYTLSCVLASFFSEHLALSLSCLEFTYFYFLIWCPHRRIIISGKYHWQEFFIYFLCLGETPSSLFRGYSKFSGWEKGHSKWCLGNHMSPEIKQGATTCKECARILWIISTAQGFYVLFCNLCTIATPIPKTAGA